MYVPKKLQNYFELIEEKHGTNIIAKGTLICCGQHDFSISYLGELKTSLIGHKAIFPENDAIVLTAKCKTCGKEIQVLNSYTDGYDSCVSDSISPSLPKFNNFPCPKCSANWYSIEISFEYQTKEELEEDGVQEYENAFSWIWISLICSSCKKNIKNLIDLETS